MCAFVWCTLMPVYTHAYRCDIVCTHRCVCKNVYLFVWARPGEGAWWTCAPVQVRRSKWREEICCAGNFPQVLALQGQSPPLPDDSPMTTALTVSKMKAFRRRKRSTCSSVMVCRRKRVRSALCCRPSSSRCSQPTRPSRWPLSRRNKLLPWLLIVYLRGTKGPGPGEGPDRRWMWEEWKGGRSWWWTQRESKQQGRGGVGLLGCAWATWEHYQGFNGHVLAEKDQGLQNHSQAWLGRDREVGHNIMDVFCHSLTPAPSLFHEVITSNWELTQLTNQTHKSSLSINFTQSLKQGTLWLAPQISTVWCLAWRCRQMGFPQRQNQQVPGEQFVPNKCSCSVWMPKWATGRGRVPWDGNGDNSWSQHLLRIHFWGKMWCSQSLWGARHCFPNFRLFTFSHIHVTLFTYLNKCNLNWKL